MGVAEEGLLGVGGLQEKSLLGELWEAVGGGDFVGDVAEIQEIDAVSRPAGTTGERGGFPHGGTACDGADAFAVCEAGWFFGKLFPRGVSEAVGIQQGGWAAGVSGEIELVEGLLLEVFRLVEGWGTGGDSENDGGE